MFIVKIINLGELDPKQIPLLALIYMTGRIIYLAEKAGVHCIAHDN